MRPLRGWRGPLGLAALAALLFTGAGGWLLGRDDEKKARSKEKAVAREKGKEKEKAALVNVGDLHAEVSALQVLAALTATPAQLNRIRLLAAKTMQEAPPKKLVRVSDAYRRTLSGLRAAILKGDDDAAEELHDKLGELTKKEAPEIDEVELTAEARKQAPALARALSARQVVRYVGGVHDFPDPTEQLVAALAESRKLSGKEWELYRDDTAYQFGWLVAGVSAAGEEKARVKATALLNRAHEMDGKTFAAQREALEKSAGDLTGKVSPTDVIRHYMERVLAELLSNHRLADVLKTWQRHQQLAKEREKEKKED